MPEEVPGNGETALGLMTVRDAARYLGVPATFLMREARAGRVPCIRMGNRVLVNVMAVSAALNRQAAGQFADSLFGQLPAPAVPEPLAAPASEENMD